MIVRNSDTECPTQVRWPTGRRIVSDAIRSVTRTVRSRVEPPAPYVTETKAGCKGSSSRIAVHSRRSASSSFGGKNSNEHAGREPPRASSSGWLDRMGDAGPRVMSFSLGEVDPVATRGRHGETEY